MVVKYRKCKKCGKKGLRKKTIGYRVSRYDVMEHHKKNVYQTVCRYCGYCE